MDTVIKPRVKICCINSIEEAKLAIEFGASALGLVSEMPSGPGVISDEVIFEIAKEDFTKIQTIFSVESLDTYFSIISFGVNAELSRRKNISIKK